MLGFKFLHKSRLSLNPEITLSELDSFPNHHRVNIQIFDSYNMYETYVLLTSPIEIVFIDSKEIKSVFADLSINLLIITKNDSITPTVNTCLSQSRHLYQPPVFY